MSTPPCLIEFIAIIEDVVWADYTPEVSGRISERWKRSIRKMLENLNEKSWLKNGTNVCVPGDLGEVRFIPGRQLKFHISISCDISYNMSGYRAGLTDDVILYFAVNAHLYRWHNYQYIWLWYSNCSAKEILEWLFNCQSSNSRRIREICGNMLGTSGRCLKNEMRDKSERLSILNMWVGIWTPRSLMTGRTQYSRYWVILRFYANTISTP